MNHKMKVKVITSIQVIIPIIIIICLSLVGVELLAKFNRSDELAKIAQLHEETLRLQTEIKELNTSVSSFDDVVKTKDAKIAELEKW